MSSQILILQQNTYKTYVRYFNLIAGTKHRVVVDKLVAISEWIRWRREPEAVVTSIENIKKAIPRSTLYKNRWSVRIFEVWQAERENKLVKSEDNPFALDVTQVK